MINVAWINTENSLIPHGSNNDICDKTQGMKQINPSGTGAILLNVSQNWNVIVKLVCKIPISHYTA